MNQRWSDAGSPPINPPGTSTTPRPDAGARMAALSARVRRDRHLLRHPETDWMPERIGPDGKPLLDVLIAGAGQGGLGIAAQLMRERVSNIEVIDKAPRGQEGVWNTIGRMPYIRSPKNYPGPDMGNPNLSYETWHRTRFGDADWEAIKLIPCATWVEYLTWYREVLALPVRNEVALTRIEPAPGCLKLTLTGPRGPEDQEQRYVRRLVLATGHDGTGRWWLPEFIAALPGHLRAQASDPIDFAGLKGKRVAVLGVGATAGDSAICALEAGAAEVRMYCRRPSHRRQQVYRWCITAGFLRHYQDLDDARRWKFMQYILNERMGMPVETWRRVNEFAGFHLETEADWQGVSAVGEEVRIETPRGAFAADFVIACTGHDQDLTVRPELAPLAPDIALWADRYTPPADLADERLGRYPYLGKNYEFLEKTPGAAPHLARIHDFTFGPTMSLGPSGCSISTLRLTVPLVAAGITRGLFVEDAELHWDSLVGCESYIP